MKNTFFRRLFALILLTLSLTGCQGISPKPTAEDGGAVYSTEPIKHQSSPALDRMRNGEVATELNTNPEYKIGPGDVLELRVWQYPELSVPDLLVGPDGMISVPRAGPVRIADMTRDQASNLVTAELGKFYADISLTLSVRVYRNNKAYVLGAVTTPGIVYFTGPGSLIEAITSAGGIADRTSALAGTEAAIIRGRNQIIWVDLGDLLTAGNTAINTPVHANDVVYIPPARQTLVYVMGEVATPRAVPLTASMTYLDAIMLAGGPTRGAKLEKSYLIRWKEGKGNVKEIDLLKVMNGGDFSQNYLLKDKDVIYVGPTGIATLNYWLDEMYPTLRTMSLTNTTIRDFE